MEIAVIDMVDHIRSAQEAARLEEREYCCEELEALASQAAQAGDPHGAALLRKAALAILEQTEVKA